MGKPSKLGNNGSVGSGFQCPQCRMVFKTKFNMKTHQLRKHQNEKTMHECELCNKCYASKYALKRHCENVHADAKVKIWPALTNPKQYECPVCRKGFSYRSNRLMHIKIYHAEHSLELQRTLVKHRTFKYARTPPKRAAKVSIVKESWMKIELEIWDEGAKREIKMKSTRMYDDDDDDVDEMIRVHVTIPALRRTDGYPYAKIDIPFNTTMRYSIPQPTIYRIGKFYGDVSDLECMLGSGICPTSAVDAFVTNLMKNKMSKYVYLPMQFYIDGKKHPDFSHLPQMDLKNKIVLSPNIHAYDKDKYHTYLAIINFERKSVHVYDSLRDTLVEQRKNVKSHIATIVKHLIDKCDVGYKEYSQTYWKNSVFFEYVIQQNDDQSCSYMAILYINNILNGNDKKNISNIPTYIMPRCKDIRIKDHEIAKTKWSLLSIKNKVMSTLLKTTPKGRQILTALTK
ncbi:unnamed protein product [Orchesella dallaii]|uniref:C2H2-type domain-containing protein n=1 Tax=Orchesella dallaii TaxID=48710 RepID=A0ABP1QGY3_9HEXA